MMIPRPYSLFPGRPMPLDKSPPCCHWQTHGAPRLAHVDLANRVRPGEQIGMPEAHKKRLPDEPEPWASGVHQANPSTCSPKFCATVSFINSITARQLTVSGTGLFTACEINPFRFA